MSAAPGSSAAQVFLRQTVAVEALSWLGTPYHHHGRIKGVGVDCAMLLAEVFEAVGLVAHVPLGPSDYPADWHLHHSRELFEEWLLRCGARPLLASQAPTLGDVGLWRYGRARSHGGIVVDATDPPQVVHAYLGQRVGLTRCDEAPLSGHRVRWYTLFGA